MPREGQLERRREDPDPRVPAGFGDRFMGELSAAPNGRLDVEHLVR